VSDLQKRYENKRIERAIGLSIHGGVTSARNLIDFCNMYSSWPEGQEVTVAEIKLLAKQSHELLITIEKLLVNTSNVFYANLITREVVTAEGVTMIATVDEEPTKTEEVTTEAKPEAT